MFPILRIPIYLRRFLCKCTSGRRTKQTHHRSQQLENLSCQGKHTTKLEPREILNLANIQITADRVSYLPKDQGSEISHGFTLYCVRDCKDCNLCHIWRLISSQYKKLWTFAKGLLDIRGDCNLERSKNIAKTIVKVYGIASRVFPSDSTWATRSQFGDPPA